MEIGYPMRSRKMAMSVFAGVILLVGLLVAARSVADGFQPVSVTTGKLTVTGKPDERVFLPFVPVQITTEKLTASGK